MRISDWSSDVCSSDLLIVAVISVGYGAIAVAAGFTLRAHITTPFSLRFVSKGIGVTPGRAILNILPPYLCALLMAAAVTFMRIDLLKDQSIFIRLLICMIAGVVLYVVALGLFSRPFMKTNFVVLNALLHRRDRKYTRMNSIH